MVPPSIPNPSNNPNTTPNIPAPSNLSFSDKEAHYNSLIELFKYCFTGIGLILTVFGGFISWTAYSDGKEMREDVKARRSELQERYKEMQIEMKEEIVEMRTKLANKEKEVEQKEDELKGVVDNMLIITDKEIKDSKASAINAIRLVGVKAITTANIAAKDQIKKVFEQKNLESFIEETAKEKLTPKISSIVNLQMEDARKYSNEVSTLYESVHFAYISPAGFLQLDSLERFSTSNDIRNRSRKFREDLKKELPQEYKVGMDEFKNLSVEGQIQKYFSDFNPEYLKVLNEKTIVNAIYNTITDVNKAQRDYGVMRLLNGFILIINITGKNISMLDLRQLETINREFNANPYPLKLH